MPSRSSGRRAVRLAAVPVAAAVGLGALSVPSAQALSSAPTASGATVNINDARRPGLDTGSIRNVTGSGMEGFVYVVAGDQDKAAWSRTAVLKVAKPKRR